MYVSDHHGKGDDRQQLDEERHDVELEAGSAAAEEERCRDGADEHAQEIAHHGEQQRQSEIASALPMTGE